jgi:hypothetical protein
MRKALMLLAMVTLVIWLARGAPHSGSQQMSREWFVSKAAAAPEPQSCSGCDPDQESACVAQGGVWDSTYCVCDTSCDPSGSQASDCFAMGGTWDPASCSCTPPACDPSPEVVSDNNLGDCSYCDGEYWQDCECHVYYHTSYCQDGSVYYEWSEYAEVCSPSDEYCGNDPCYDDPYCYCYWDYCS